MADGKGALNKQHKNKTYQYDFAPAAKAKFSGAGGAVSAELPGETRPDFASFWVQGFRGLEFRVYRVQGFRVLGLQDLGFQILGFEG